MPAAVRDAEGDALPGDVDATEPAAPDGAVERARAGDRPAFDALYRRHAAMVHGILIASVPAGAAEDLVQDAFLAAWRGLADLRDPARFGPWVAGIARNLARRHHRAPAAMEPLPETLAGPRARSGDGLDADAVLAALRGLPEAYRETLALRLVEDLSGPEIAAATGRSHGAVRVNLTRGMKLLRESLRKGGVA